MVDLVYFSYNRAAELLSHKPVHGAHRCTWAKCTWQSVHGMHRARCTWRVHGKVYMGCTARDVHGVYMAKQLWRDYR